MQLESSQEDIDWHRELIVGLQKQNDALQINLVARNDREFQVLYGNAPQSETAYQVASLPEEDDYENGTTVLDFHEEAVMFGLMEQPVGPLSPETEA